jgi:hypothetical protein
VRSFSERTKPTWGAHTWRSRNRAAERYLSQIAIWGYDLSETEQSVIKDDSDEQRLRRYSNVSIDAP